MLAAIITYSVTPCPACGVDMPGTGTVSDNGQESFDGVIYCDNCTYLAHGKGKTAFFAASATAEKHQSNIKKVDKFLMGVLDSLICLKQ
jgi:hypothetical protein